MTLSVDTKRQLLSVVRMWLDEALLLNRKAKRNRPNFASMSGGQVSATTDTEFRMLECMRELFGSDGNLLELRVRMMTILDVHVLTLALEHAYNGVRHLLPTLSPNAAARADDFVQAWKTVRDVRNGLEHEEEYLAGTGKFPEQVDANWTPPAVGVSRHYIVGEAGILAISALGRSYNVAETIAAAEALVDAISAEAALVALRTNDERM